MKPFIPWKPNTSGAPDPFFNGRREYLEKLNDLIPATITEHSVTPDGEHKVTITGRRPPFDPEAFHPVTGYIVPITERSHTKEES